MDKAERHAEMQAIHAELEGKLAALTTSDEWRAALDVAGRFHHYSLNNVLWLMVQAERRDLVLTHVAGFRTWQKLGRQVRRGERSLKVLAPARYKVTDDDGNERWQVRGFSIASVFDVSQTDGEPLAECAPRLLIGDGSESAILDQVVGLVTARGFSFDLVPASSLGGANGVTDHTAHTVCVRDDVSVAQQVKTAVHELAHVILHAPETTNYRSNRGRCEVEAESVAYVVLASLGIPADDYSLPYVAGWSSGDAAAVRATAETVIKTAHGVVESLTARPVAVPVAS